MKLAEGAKKNIRVLPCQDAEIVHITKASHFQRCLGIMNANLDIAHLTMEIQLHVLTLKNNIPLVWKEDGAIERKGNVKGKHIKMTEIQNPRMTVIQMIILNLIKMIIQVDTVRATIVIAKRTFL